MLPGPEFLALCSFCITYGGRCEGRSQSRLQSEMTHSEASDWFSEIVRGSYKDTEKWNIGKIQTWEETGKFTERERAMKLITSKLANKVIEKTVKKIFQ